MEHIAAVILKWVFSPKRLLILVVAALAVGVGLKTRAYLKEVADNREALEDRTQELTDTREELRDTRAAYARQLEDIRRQREVAENGERAARARARRFERLLNEVQNAPPEDDGPLAPVFRNAAISLRDELRGRASADAIS